jgi:hypothetical protein
MTAVIEFPAGRARKSSETDTSLKAEIIIFPGVRIERMEFSLADRIPLRKGRTSAQARQLDFEPI